MLTTPILPVYIRILKDQQTFRLYTDPAGTDEWTDTVQREVSARGVMQFFFIPDVRKAPAETADLFIIPQTVESHARRDSPFHRPEDPVHFIEDPGWGASDPSNSRGDLPILMANDGSESVFAGEVTIRGIPPGRRSPPYKFAIFARGNKARWISGIDPTVIIRPD